MDKKSKVFRIIPTTVYLWKFQLYLLIFIRLDI
jgi:hypothetical protein